MPPPQWGRLHVRMVGDPRVVIPALREVWSGYERDTAMRSYPSQLSAIVQGRGQLALLGPDVAAEQLSSLLEERHGLRDAVNVRFEPMREDDFDAAVSRL